MSGTERVRERPFAVVTLDSGDNDPATFCSGILRSVRRTCPDADGGRLERLLTGQPDIDNILAGLVEEIVANCPHIVLALDNYQAITEPACHVQVEHLLNQLPLQARLVLATRTDPPLPLARMRAAGSVVELRMDDLRFTREEVSRLTVRSGGPRLPDADLDILVDRTEGWPAVVHLAVRLLKEEQDPAAFLRCFRGDNRYVVDYLEEEVLRHVPDEVQRFLVSTAILDRFTARLCDAVADITNSGDLLNAAERSNLFLVPLDDVRTWYRYHYLFGQTLRARLARTEPDLESTLHRRAGTWYEQHGNPAKAIEHTLAAGDSDRAIRLIARHWADHIYRGKLATTRHWLSTLGTAGINRTALTAICAAWVAALSGDRLGGQRWLKNAERLGHRGPLPDGMHSLRGAMALYQSTFGFGGLTEMLAAARTAADLHGDPASPWYAQARVALGYSRYLAGDTRAAVHPLEQAMEAATTFPVLRILALSALSLVTAELGRSAQSADLALAAHELVTADGLSESSEVTLARVAYAAMLVRQGHLRRAREVLEHAVRIRRPIIGLPPWPTLNALVLLARVALATGDRAAARALLDEAADLLEMVPDGTGQIRAGLADIERRLAGAERYAIVTPRLTDREEAVLRLLQGSLPLREVAAELFVTVNTVKSHTRLIYRKLGATSRTEAVRRARELGLL
ncbi:MAG: LuxR C-terminal-related transcriptional regulator [Pseudonocardiaceae bacterium]